MRVTREHWQELDAMEAAAARSCAPAFSVAKELVDSWTKYTATLGSTPSDEVWKNFRPLRLSQEEDWSDWLAFLLEEGPSRFVREFLNINAVRVRAQREFFVAPYRADIVLSLDENAHASLEVKLRDQDLAKTFACCSALESTAPGPWHHFILVPEERLQEWTDLVAQRQAAAANTSPVLARTWTNVAGALRHCIFRGEGTLAWRIWAVAYCGAVEQRIVELPSRRELDLGHYWLLGRAARLSEHLSSVMESVDGDNG